eukprot:6197202-Pleurochrysis_carterae.AAC.1
MLWARNQHILRALVHVLMAVLTQASPLPTQQSTLVSTRSGLRYVDFDLGNPEKPTPRCDIPWSTTSRPS